ncbi:hypothetical protein B0H13DRAFT_1851538 [Mycena leptocephala]|nr:hypothetical protein B0H13DRAFT_1851538 [Mycena leptocephala]
MAFFGQYPSTAGPNDPPPLPPVIDPILQGHHPDTTNDCITALERQVHELTTQKHANSNTRESSPKRRKKNKKSSPYLLKDNKNLSGNQKEVRKKLMGMVKRELMNLTGMKTNVNSDSDTDMEDASSHTVDREANMKVIDWAADLICKEQSWKDWKQHNDPVAAARQARQASKDCQAMRRRDLKRNRLKAVKEYKKKHNKDAVCVLETNWMSDEISALDTDDDQKKANHRQRLIQASRLPPAHQDRVIWEVVHPEFQSTECINVKDELDAIRKKQKQTSKRPSRGAVIHVNLANTHNRVPAGTLWPFMLSQDWYDSTIEGKPELEEVFNIYAKNPKGFGEDGYAGDDEG